MKRFTIVAILILITGNLAYAGKSEPIENYLDPYDQGDTWQFSTTQESELVMLYVDSAVLCQDVSYGTNVELTIQGNGWSDSKEMAFGDYWALPDPLPGSGTYTITIAPSKILPDPYQGFYALTVELEIIDVPILEEHLPTNVEPIPAPPVPIYPDMDYDGYGDSNPLKETDCSRMELNTHYVLNNSDCIDTNEKFFSPCQKMGCTNCPDDQRYVDNCHPNVSNAKTIFERLNLNHFLKGKFAYDYTSVPPNIPPGFSIKPPPNEWSKIHMQSIQHMEASLGTVDYFGDFVLSSMAHKTDPRIYAAHFGKFGNPDESLGIVVAEARTNPVPHIFHGHPGGMQAVGEYLYVAVEPLMDRYKEYRRDMISDKLLDCYTIMEPNETSADLLKNRVNPLLETYVNPLTEGLSGNLNNTGISDQWTPDLIALHQDMENELNAQNVPQSYIDDVNGQIHLMDYDQVPEPRVFIYNLDRDFYNPAIDYVKSFEIETEKPFKTKSACLGITKLEDGTYLLAVCASNNCEVIKFYKSSLSSPLTIFDYIGIWKLEGSGLDTQATLRWPKCGPQNINLFVQQDGRIFVAMLGWWPDALLKMPMQMAGEDPCGSVGHNHVFLYSLDIIPRHSTAVTDPDHLPENPYAFFLLEYQTHSIIVKTHLCGDSLNYTGGINFAAGGGLMISPEGRDDVAILGIEHYNSCGAKIHSGGVKWWDYLTGFQTVWLRVDDFYMTEGDTRWGVSHQWNQN